MPKLQGQAFLPDQVGQEWPTYPRPRYGSSWAFFVEAVPSPLS